MLPALKQSDKFVSFYEFPLGFSVLFSLSDDEGPLDDEQDVGENIRMDCRAIFLRRF